MNTSSPGLVAEKRFRDLLNNINDLVTVASPEGVFLYVSPSCKKIQGYDPGEMEGQSAFDFVHPEDITHLARTTSALVNGEYSGPVVFRGKKKEGGYVWLESTGKAVLDENGDLLEIHGCTRDITDRILYERELERKNSQMREQAAANEKIKEELLKEKLFKESITEYNPTGIAALDLDLNITEWNPALEKITGVKKENAVGRNWLDIYRNAENTEAHQLFRRTLEGETFFIPERRFSGREGYYSTYLTPLKDTAGKIFGMVTFVTDITEQKQNELLLAEQKSFLDRITNTAPSIIYVFDIIEETYLFVNRELLQLLGYEQDEINNDTLALRARIIHPDHAGIPGKRLERICMSQDNEVIEDEMMVKDKAGNWHWLQSRVVVFKRTPEGKVWQILGTVLDITAAKQAEAAVMELKAAESLLKKKEEFIGIASHELKTPLTSIKAYMQLLQYSFDELTDESKKQFIDRAGTYIEKLNKLVEDLLDISRIQAGRMMYTMIEFALDNLVQECVENYQRISAKHTIELNGSTGRIVKGDRQRLEQVLTNLLSNAIKYSPAANKVIINTRAEKDLVAIDVTDFGIGIPPDKQAHIFDRFYRVEEAPSYIPGLGIGLYISREIVNRHGGSITVRSTPGGETTFTITLPVIS